MKITPAQRRFLFKHTNQNRNGYLTKFEGTSRATYNFIGRIRRLGLIEIDNGDCAGWPWSWAGTRITDAGRKALEGK